MRVVRMKQGQQQLKLLNSMPSLVGALCSTENYKGMSLINSCHILNHVSCHLKAVLHQDLRHRKKKNLKHGYIYVKENEL